MAHEVCTLSSDDETFPEEQQVNIVEQRKLQHGALIGLGTKKGSTWISDQTVFDYLCLKLPDFLVIEPLVFQASYNINSRGIIGSREDAPQGVVLMPVQYEDHWILGILEIQLGMVAVFDTLRKKLHENIWMRMEDVAKMLIKKFPGTEPNHRTSDAVYVVEARDDQYAMQFDLVNCGPLVCMLACAYCARQSMFFNEEDIAEWRRQAFEFLVTTEMHVKSHRIGPLKKADGAPKRANLNMTL
ncbi:hypothetical protein QR680_006562 [Steinernema hermaphroditum]|uniref:Ubiquitin-like protease family profile domain-containing protein n=1 Tax=Steinernema hermaphroditum TaxID=289476 RepID=A0AA39LXC1_9BILA|nr:hypothetical protein QR680_006562 [Steinernema hermaphroditum]